jgi:hypothetical protein
MFPNTPQTLQISSFADKGGTTPAVSKKQASDRKHRQRTITPKKIEKQETTPIVNVAKVTLEHRL